MRSIKKRGMVRGNVHYKEDRTEERCEGGGYKEEEGSREGGTSEQQEE